jgi:hypothetical protein
VTAAFPGPIGLSHHYMNTSHGVKMFNLHLPVYWCMWRGSRSSGYLYVRSLMVLLPPTAAFLVL